MIHCTSNSQSQSNHYEPSRKTPLPDVDTFSNSLMCADRAFWFHYTFESERDACQTPKKSAHAEVIMAAKLLTFTNNRMKEMEYDAKAAAMPLAQSANNITLVAMLGNEWSDNVLNMMENFKDEADILMQYQGIGIVTEYKKNEALFQMFSGLEDKARLTLTFPCGKVQHSGTMKAQTKYEVLANRAKSENLYSEYNTK